MLHILHSTHGGVPDHILRGMFAARKSVFIDLLKWDVPVLAGLYEIDQFDDQHASYLVLTDENDAHMASARLLPTTREHILGDIFPELCEVPAPRGETIYEITRFCLDRSLNARDRRTVRDTLVNAIVGHALVNDITTYTAIAEMGWYSQILAFGWDCRPLGLPHSDGTKTIAALAITIDSATPGLLDAAGIRSMSTTLPRDNRVAA
ncbi:autoinducer synthase (plasmid) [Sphingomonas paeninsulae]|uniref:Acyl-homoserine-lactone synthase n=1 Tax=Sphingomonas paeninsulae TaxID=2319844 RepID=A0A494TBR2_SPHPE|nr:acyl-homoserine-lactone synthase [Sphingomonas paeninsulae]AYJ84852.1 autoinducer synthase [Sphingomonas paeninsulae]